jgi:hypothetical protein
MTSSPIERLPAVRVLALAVLAGLAAPAVCAAQAVSAADREALVRLRLDRGGRAEDVDALIRLADELSVKGLPASPVTNKIREGLAKGHDPGRIEAVIRQIAGNVEEADRLLRDVEPASTLREPAVPLLVEALGSGVTPGTVRELSRLARAASKGGNPISANLLSSASKGLSFIAQARLPIDEGTALVAEAVARGFRAHELVDLGREVKRRDADFLTGRASLRALRAAIARGDRPDQLFPTRRPDAVERPGAIRPEGTVDRPTRPEPVHRPEPPTRSDRPERPERPTNDRGR